MTSTIKVDNIQDQCGTAVVTKCGSNKTLAVTTTKADNYQAADGGNIINQCGTAITIGASGDTVTLASGASQSGFGRSGTVDWQTGSIKTANFTAADGEGYFCNTSGGAFTVTLPSGSAGAIVAVSDYTRTFQTNNLTISPQSGEKIGGIVGDATLSTEGQTATFVYVDSTEGWINIQETSNSVTAEAFISATGGTITTSGDFKIHTFTSPGTFCVSSLATTPGNNEVSYLVVAGGGGGTANPGNDNGAGGGAGGFREKRAANDSYTVSPLNGAPSISVTAQGYPITVGGGGTQIPSTSPGTQGNPGSNSVFSTVTSAGGGGGAKTPSGNTDGRPGGSGGGTAGGHPGNQCGGAGNTPPVSPPQGQPGGARTGSPDQGGGGAGGATEAGQAVACQPYTSGGRGGAGATTHIIGSPTAYAGGGGTSNGAGSPCGTGGAGGAGVGGTNGTTNRGGGGGGARGYNPNNAGSGGSGVVIIRYKFQ